jgi:hypothetical protein
MRKHFKKLANLEHEIVVEDCDEVEYGRIQDWLKINVPATDRRSPKWSQPTYDPAAPTKLVFRFKTESQAMAFKLIK